MTELPECPTDLATNRELLNALLALFRPYLLATTRKRLVQGEIRGRRKVYDAEDIVQEALLKAARGVRRYDPTRAHFRHWLFMQLQSVIADVFIEERKYVQRGTHRRRVKFRGEGLTSRPDARAINPATVAERNDFWERTGRNLNAGERELLRMRYREELLRSQCAATLGMSNDQCFRRDLAMKRKLAADAELLNA
jgi:RNA polymerase sigma factor (sigma-70 family)